MLTELIGSLCMLFGSGLGYSWLTYLLRRSARGKSFEELDPWARNVMKFLDHYRMTQRVYERPNLARIVFGFGRIVFAVCMAIGVSGLVLALVAYR